MLIERLKWTVLLCTDPPNTGETSRQKVTHVHTSPYVFVHVLFYWKRSALRVGQYRWYISMSPMSNFRSSLSQNTDLVAPLSGRPFLSSQSFEIGLWTRQKGEVRAQFSWVISHDWAPLINSRKIAASYAFSCPTPGFLGLNIRGMGSSWTLVFIATGRYQRSVPIGANEDPRLVHDQPYLGGHTVTEVPNFASPFCWSIRCNVWTR